MSDPGTMTGKPLIESDRVEGTTVYDPQGNDIGSIKRLMIEKLSGRVAYAVMSFGGFLGMGSEEHTIPWSKLTYDTNLGGYRTDITEEQLRGAPAFSRDRDWDWNDRNREQLPSALLWSTGPGFSSGPRPCGQLCGGCRSAPDPDRSSRSQSDHPPQPRGRWGRGLPIGAGDGNTALS